jgi:hypothetical protein
VGNNGWTFAVVCRLSIARRRKHEALTCHASPVLPLRTGLDLLDHGSEVPSHSSHRQPERHARG